MIENFDEETAPNRRIESISSIESARRAGRPHALGGDFGDRELHGSGARRPFKNQGRNPLYNGFQTTGAVDFGPYLPNADATWCQAM